jgi:hypothetical protein
MQYQYVEVDPYKKPQALLDVNPRGLVPGIRHGDWGCGESTVLMEYVCVSSQYIFPILTISQLEDLGGPPLLPQGNPQLRASCRLWSDHVGYFLDMHEFLLTEDRSIETSYRHSITCSRLKNSTSKLKTPRSYNLKSQRLSKLQISKDPIFSAHTCRMSTSSLRLG